jgi:hypothetical protein
MKKLIDDFWLVVTKRSLLAATLLGSSAIAFGSGTLALLSSIALSGCGVADGIQDLGEASKRAVNVIDNGIKTIQDESSAWRTALEKIAKDLPADVQSTIRTEVQGLLDRTTAHAGVEIRCDTDFLAKRVLQGLQRIRAELTHDPLPTSLPPTLCQVVPSQGLDLSLAPGRRDSVEFAGYDFDILDADHHPARVVVVDRNNCEIPLPDRYVTHSTHYLWSVNTSYNNGVPLGPDATKLRMVWGPMVVGEAAIIQPSMPQKSMSVPIGTLGPYAPPLVRGDSEFAGNGPDVNVSADLVSYPDRLSVKLCMRAEEVGGDTLANGCVVKTGWSAPPNLKIVRVISSTSSRWHYRDTNLDPDSIDLPSGDLVHRFSCIGDLRGDDVGKTSCSALFNPVQVLVEDVAAMTHNPSQASLVCTTSNR